MPQNHRTRSAVCDSVGFLMAVDPSALIHEVYRQSRSKSVPPPFVTRVVKLIYLADLEWRRRHGGPLANVEWRFLHFGPYAYEFVPLLGDPDMEVAEFEGRAARRFTFDSMELSVPRVPGEVSSIIGDLVTRWGSADLNRLLDHVYFETEPMENARRGEILDFSTIKPATPKISPNFDEAKLKALRARLKDQVAKLGLTQEGLHVPVFDYDSQRIWDADSAETKLPVGLRVSREMNGE
jgi:hypothetical protein